MKGETVRRLWEDTGQFFALMSLLLLPKGRLLCSPLPSEEEAWWEQPLGWRENLKRLDMGGAAECLHAFHLPPQFQILRKLSQEPVATAIPSAVTPRQLTLLS